MSVPTLNVLQYAARGDALEIFTEAGASQRVSLTLVDTTWVSPVPAKFRIEIFDQTGRRLDDFTQELPLTWIGYTIDDLFGSRGLTPPPAARIVVTALEGPTIANAFVMLTDIGTGDTAYVGAHYGGTARQ